MTSKEIATWKRQARLVHTLGESKSFLNNCPKAMEKMARLESTLAKLEAKMTPEQEEKLTEWAYENSLYGILGTC